MVLFPNLDVEEETATTRSRERNTVARLLAVNALADGTPLSLQPGNEMASATRKVVMEWVAEDPIRGKAP